MMSKCHSNIFSTFWAFKKRFGRSRGCDFLCRQVALRTHNLSSERLKKGLWWRRWSDASCFRKGKRTFSVSWESKKRLGRCRVSDVLIWRVALRTHILPSGNLKKRHCCSRWSDVSMGQKAIRTHFLSSKYPKKRLERIRFRNVWSSRMTQRTRNLPSGRFKNDFV
jgi:hypothetical protein